MLFGPGESSAQACAEPASGSTKSPLCPLCFQRFKHGQPRRKWQGKPAHAECVRDQYPSSSSSPRAASAPSSPVLSRQAGRKEFSVRLKRKPYDKLGPTQRQERKNLALEFLQAIDLPVQALARQQPPPEELFHLSQADRQRIRSIPSFSIPGEQAIRAAKLAAAQTHATETAKFDTGAYVTDPLHFVSVVAGQSPRLTVGGDSATRGGHQFLKLGFTYERDGTQTFAALLIMQGGDDWESMDKLRQPGLTPFSGASAFNHIFAVLQHLIDQRSAFLNGDWKFLNAVLGIKAPGSSHYPCCICRVHSSNFLSLNPDHRRLRSADDLPRMRLHAPLLSIPPERIVPTPLHVVLGLGNRVIFKAFKQLAGEAAVLASFEGIKTIHMAGSGGLSDIHALNGPELKRWLQKTTTASFFPSPTPEQRRRSTLLLQWMQRLQSELLSGREWTPAQIEEWRSFVQHMLPQWRAETDDDAFPKLHMLTHSYEFMERHRVLGRLADSQMESYHAAFNRLFDRQHLNQAPNPAERVRRTLADTTLQAAQPALTSLARRRHSV